MKKILFICPNMNVGGVQKSLLALLDCFDYNKYDVELLLLSPNGYFQNYVNENVTILSSNIPEEFFYSPLKSLSYLLLKFKLKFLFIKIITLFLNRIDKGKSSLFLARRINAIEKNYDTIVDYGGQVQLYYMIEKLHAKKKISYFHNDYAKWNYYENMDRKYYKCVDNIVTVSDTCLDSLRNIFPEYSDKMLNIENIISKKSIKLFFDEVTRKLDEKTYAGTVILTVGRVCLDKGIDIAIKAAELLMLKKIDFTWLWVGPFQSKSEESKIKKVITAKGLQNKFILCGSVRNPYSYYSKADICVFPSRFEGKAMTIEEAKILQKVIFVTDYSTVKDQIIDQKTGFVTKIDASDLSDKIHAYLSGELDATDILLNLKVYEVGNESEKYKLYNLL